MFEDETELEAMNDLTRGDVLMDEDDVAGQALRRGRMEGIRESWFKIEQAMSLLRKYQRSQHTAAEMAMSRDCMILALQMYLVLGSHIKGPSDLARLHNVKKQTVDKCLNLFIEQLKLPPLPGQRGEQARAAMTTARNEQVRGSGKR